MTAYKQPDIGHMPFNGHRTCKEVREDQEARAIRRELGNARMSRDQLPWCPKEYREEYQRLRLNKHLGATEARRLIELQISTDERRGATFVPVGERKFAGAYNPR